PLAPCSPITQRSASRMFDLPDPLGPTTQVMPGSRRRVVAEAKDLKPFSVRDLRYTINETTRWSGHLVRPTRLRVLPDRPEAMRDGPGEPRRARFGEQDR